MAVTYSDRGVPKNWLGSRRVFSLLLTLASGAFATRGVAQESAAFDSAIDHARLDGVLKRFVDDQGLVDYAALKKESSELDAYIRQLAEVQLDSLRKQQRLACMINAYNAFTLRLIIDYYPVESIKDIPSSKRWKHRRWTLGGKTWSLDDIEHEGIRKGFDEPRIHFTLVCAAIGCPKLRNEAFVAERLEAQLQDQTSYVHGHQRWLKVDVATGIVWLTRLYKWYGSDFDTRGGPVKFASRYSDPLASMAAVREPSIRWLEYDWKLNKQR
ncbi:MAG: DUF547 domain-containing protein [Planctomycetota bacterium]